MPLHNNIDKLINSIITQNIDWLHIDAGNKFVCEIHGNRNFLRCVSCHNKFVFDAPITKKPPNCNLCDGIIKYDSVMFGEPIPKKILDKDFADKLSEIFKDDLNEIGYQS